MRTTSVRSPRPDSAISTRSQTWSATLKLDQAQTYRDYFTKIQDLAGRVNKFLEREIQAGGKVFGLGASTKGNVLLQFLGITKERMPYISERNPDKVGLRTLGTDFELISEQRARDLRPSTMVVLPWYFKRKSSPASRIISGRAASCCSRCPMRTW
mgnify:CR=1 FL=1